MKRNYFWLLSVQAAMILIAGIIGKDTVFAAGTGSGISLAAFFTIVSVNSAIVVCKEYHLENRIVSMKG